MLRFALTVILGAALCAQPSRADEAAWPAANISSAPAPIWQGLYIGGIGGGQSADGEIVNLTTGRAKNTSSSSGFGGVSAGYNWQSGALVLGVEGDWSWVPDNSGPGLATIRGRAGWSFGNVLVYGTVGGGFVNGTLTRLADQQRVEQQFTGWVAGGGVEAMLTHSISLKAEVLFFDAGKEHFNFNAAGALPATSATWEIQDVIYRAGLTYHFN